MYHLYLVPLKMFVSSWLILMAPFDGESILFSTKSTNLVIGLLKVCLPIFESATWSVTLCTSWFLSASTPIILANGHWLCWQSYSFNIMSPTSKFLLWLFHFYLVCKLCRNPFLHHLYQNSSAICPCSMHLHLLLEYRSGFVKRPGGGMITFVFIVNRLLGESGIWLLISLKVSTVCGLELIIDSTSAIKVLIASSFNDWPCVFSNPSEIPLAVLLAFPHNSYMWCSRWVLVPQNPIITISQQKILDF